MNEQRITVKEAQLPVWKRLAMQDPHRIRAHSYVNLPAEEGSFPLVIFMPEPGKFASEYTVLAEELASRGYIVVGIDSGYRAEYAKGLKLAELSAENASDIAAVIDRLDQKNRDPRYLLFHRLRMDSIGLYGFLPGKTVGAGSLDPGQRIKAVIRIGGGEVGEPQLSASTKSARYRFIIKGMRSSNFSDAAVAFHPLEKLTGQLGRIDGSRGLWIAGSFLSGFFDTYLNNKDKSNLTRLTAAFPELKLE